jgi:hypothetical protein
MLNISEIRTDMFGVVGLRQPYDPKYAILDATLLVSSSGMYFEQYCSYVTIENLFNTQPFCYINSTNFNLTLTNAIKDSISKGIQSCFMENDIIENKLLYDYSNRKTSDYELVNGSDFVGYEITVSKRKDIKAIVNKVFTEFSGTGSLKLLLFNDNSVTTQQTKSITVTSKTALETVLNWELPYSNGVAGGKYYIGYLTNGLTPKAINREWNGSNRPNRYNALSIKPVKIPNWTTETLFDIDTVEYTANTYGLNFDISSYRDYTSIVVNNKNMFTDVIGYQFAADMLGLMIATNVETELPVKGNLLLELQGNFNSDNLPMVKGVMTKLTESIEIVKRKLTEQPLMQKLTFK